ncbi:hypothetical protein JW859_13095 [bacterium]|nr:hypothetical protein [bacterium]
MDFLIPVVLFIIVGACIVIPIWLRHKLYYYQLTAIAKAIEKGVDPAVIKDSLVIPRRQGDINGNWKAGVLLLAFGVAVFLLSLPEVLNGDNFNGEWLMPLIIPVIGITLIVIHRQVVGPVVKVRPEHEQY